MWLPSAKNPSDRASRVHFTGETGEYWKTQAQDPLPSEEVFTALPQGWGSRERLFLHLCSGPMRQGDVCEHVDRQAHEYSLGIKSVRVDPCNDSKYDLAQHDFRLHLISLIAAGDVVGIACSPPCSTVSRARHVPLQGNTPGPRPLRSRTNVFTPMEHLTEREQRAVNLGSVLGLACFDMLGRVWAAGGWRLFEHPADPGREPYPSFFCSPEFDFLTDFTGGRLVVAHQCRWGSPSTKPTGIFCTDKSLAQRFALRCNHVGGHKPLIGKNKTGGFSTTKAARYTSMFCQHIADTFVHYMLSIHDPHGARARPPWPEPWPHSRLSLLSASGKRPRAIQLGPRSFQQ